MQLNVRDVARLLQVTEKTVYGWVREGGIPTTKVHGQHRFNRSELLEWATANHVAVPAELMQSETGDAISVADALESGGIHYGLRGADKTAVLREVVQRIPFPADADREMFLRLLVAREELASTGVGDGIAIPHVRNPIVLRVGKPIVTLCFLDEPIDFGAVDDKPVHCLFTLVSPTMRAHLHVISRLAFVLRDPHVCAAIVRHADAGEIVREIRRAESGLTK